MRFKNRNSIFFLLFFLCLPHNIFAIKNKLVIDITNPNFRKFLIAIPPFQYLGKKTVAFDGSEIGKEFAVTIGNFLRLTGLFNVLDRKIGLNTIGDTNSDSTSKGLSLPDWKALKTDGLIHGQFSRTANLISTEIKFFDVTRSKLIIWKKYYKGTKSDIREVAKRFSNEMIYVLTGEAGIFKSKIVFLRTVKKYKNVYMMDIDGENVQAITNYRTIHLSPSWSPDGNKITYTSYKSGNPDLYVYSLLTKKEIRISSRKGLNIGASWTSDGKRIAFSRSIKGDSDIYTISPDGTHLKPLITGYGLDISPRFSPDLSLLAFVSGRSGSPHIWIMNPRDRKIQKLTRKGRYNADPSWAPNGKKIVFSGFDSGHFDIFIMDPDPLKPNFERLTINSSDNEHPSWSPDGKHIVFQSNREGQYELYLMNADGSNQRRLTFGLGSCTSPEWSKVKSFR